MQLRATSPTRGRATSLNDVESDVLLLIVEMVKPMRYGSRWVFQDDRCSSNDLYKPIISFSMANKRIRDLCTPVLFVKIGDTVPASKFRQQLLDMQANPIILNSITAWAVHPRQKPNDITTYPADTASMLWSNIAKMPNLTKLQIGHWGDANESLLKNLKTATKGTSDKSSSVKTLYINSEDELVDVMGACTALQNLCIHMDRKWKKTVQAASAVETLVCLELDRKQAWQVKHVDELQPLVKNVRKLYIKGELMKTKVSDFAQSFSGFPRLVELAITATQWVNIAYLCKRYMDERLLDAIDDIRDGHDCNEDHKQVAAVYFNACPKLQLLRILKDYKCETFGVVKEEGGEGQRIGKLKASSDWDGIKTINNEAVDRSIGRSFDR